jgi:hypothetical protein
MYFTSHRFVKSEKKWRMRGIDKFYVKLKCVILLVELKVLRLRHFKILKSGKRNVCQGEQLVCQCNFHILI